jgi:hypothetical protein
VNKAELIIESKPEDGVLKAVCSLCPSVHFNLTGNSLKEKQLLRGMFDLHVLRVQKPDDAAAQAKP